MSELYHYGIKNQRWGVRRFQNPDGSLTPAGRERYLAERIPRKNRTVFVSGSSKTQDKSSGYYLKRLPFSVRSELKEHMKRGDKIIVGDAPGIDRQTQDYLAKKNYTNVEVFSPGKEGARYLANPGWKQTNVDKKGAEIGSKEWLAAKDLVMSKLADKGIAVTLDQGAKATRKNVDRLIAANKDVMVYELAKREGGFIRRALASAKDVERRFAKGQELDPDYYYDEDNPFEEPVYLKSSGSKSWVEEAANDPKHWRLIENASGERLYERIEPSKSSGRYTTGSKEIATNKTASETKKAEKERWLDRTEPSIKEIRKLQKQWESKILNAEDRYYSDNKNGDIRPGYSSLVKSMRNSGLTKVEIARVLGLSEHQVDYIIYG